MLCFSVACFENFFFYSPEFFPSPQPHTVWFEEELLIASHTVCTILLRKPVRPMYLRGKCFKREGGEGGTDECHRDARCHRTATAP